MKSVPAVARSHTRAVGLRSLLRIGLFLVVLGTSVTGHGQWVAFNDHYRDSGSSPQATFYNTGNASFYSALKNITNGAWVNAFLAITNFNTTDFGSGANFTAGPALAIFSGFVDFSGNNIALNGTNGTVSHLLSGLRPDARYSLKGTSNRGEPTYTGRWTLFELEGAASFRNAHSAGCITNNPANGYNLASNQVAICTGYNTTAGAMFDWQDVNPGPDGKVSIISRKYFGPIPVGGNAVNSIAYCIAGLRVEETLDVRPPSIVVEPQHAARCEGASATFSVEAQGGGVLSYQWQKLTASATNDIPNSNAANLALPNVTPLDVAGYRVIITNTFGSVTSLMANLTLTTTPVSIQIEPLHQTNFPGDAVQFSVAANADAASPVLYQWFRRASNGSWSVLTGATNATLSFVAAPTNALQHYVRVQNCINAVTSQVATLVLVIKPLTITNQPTDAGVIVGGSVTLNVGVDGTAPAYQWFRNGTALQGATSASLPLVGLQLNASGLFHVVVSNSVSAVASRAAIISVVPPPYTLFGPTNHFWRYDQRGFDLGTAWREVEYTPETNWPTGRGVFAWEDNAAIRPLTNTVLNLSNTTYYFRTQFVLTNEPGDVFLVTSNLFDDGGVVYANGVEAYRLNMPPGAVTGLTVANILQVEGVFATNRIPGSLLKTGTNVLAVEVHQSSQTSTDVVMGLGAAVHYAPATLLGITNPPVSQNVDELRPVTFSVGYTGAAARVQWFKDGEALPGATASTLVIPAALSGWHEGEYFVVLSNAVDLVTSASATLTITQAPPTIAAPPQDQRLCPGEPLLLQVVAYGSASSKFQWLHNGAPVQGATNTAYSNPFTTTNDTGLYSVIVRNALGSTTSSLAQVEVTTLPFIIAQPKATGAPLGSSAQFNVSAGGCGPFSYQWQFAEADIVGATNSTFRITNVLSSDEGLYRVRIMNAGGATFSASVPLVTSIGVALGAPELNWTVPSGVWSVESSWTHDGVASVRASGSVSSFLQTTITGPAKLSFWTRLEGPSIRLYFRVDGRIEESWFAARGWAPHEFYIPAGNHVLAWEAGGSQFMTNSWVFLDQMVFTTNGLGPVIVVAPQSVTVPAGGGAAFRVVAEGLPEFRHQWQSNGVDISGATQEILSLDNVQAHHAASYTVLVSNDVGFASASATLTVTPSAPEVFVPVRVLARAGREVILTAQARGSEPLSYQWNQNGSPVAGATNVSLNLGNQPTNWLAQYSVSVSNAFGGIVSSNISIVLARVTNIVHISVDGLGSRHLFNGLINEPVRFPSFRKLLRESASTWNARCDYTYSITVPNHLSMLLGRPVTQPPGQPATVHHGYTNNFSTVSGTVHKNGNTNVGYFFSVFDMVHDRDGSTAFYATKSSLNVCSLSYDANNGAPDLLPPDHGRNKVDLAYFASATSIATDTLLQGLTNTPYNYAFLHCAETDTAGHTYGWGSPRFFDALQGIDIQLGRILSAIENHANPEVRWGTAIILTADHGGEGKNHLEPAVELDHTIPLFVWGAGFFPGSDLYLVLCQPL